MKTLRFVVGGNHTNAYLIFGADGGEGVVIDPGADAPLLMEKIRAHNLRIREILLTHGHFDHILALDELREATGAGLAVHSADAVMLSDGRKSYALPFAGRTRPFMPPTRLLSDGDEIICDGVRLFVMHTPGHTPGSVCFAGEGEIFTGDTLFAGSVGRCDLWGGDETTLLFSLDRFSSFPDNTRIFSGHGNSTTLLRERAENPFLRK